MRRVMMIGLAASLLAASLGAQQGQGGMHQGMGMGMGQGGMQGMGMMVPGPLRQYLAFAPEKVLEIKGMLELTSDQEAKLTALQAETKAASEAAHAPAMAAMQSLRKELESASPDMAKVEAFFTAHNTAMGNTQWIAVSTALKARALLTEAQRQHVEHHAQEKGGGMGGMQHGKPPR